MVLTTVAVAELLLPTDESTWARVKATPHQEGDERSYMEY